MRIPVRRITQVIAVLACFIVTNFLVIVLNPQRPNSDEFSDFLKSDSNFNGEVGDEVLARHPRGLSQNNNAKNSDFPGRKVSSLDNIPIISGNNNHIKKDVFETDSIQTISSVTNKSNKQISMISVDDLFISVKTTGAFHKSRLKVLVDTWVSMAKHVTYFFTDVDDKEFNQVTGGRMINTNCSSVHTRRALCCKMAVEFDTYIASKKKWFCHVDDDTYVNIPTLMELLKQYNYKQDWYIGKPSLNHPLEIRDLDAPQTKTLFWFATGGAGFCISRALALKMMPYTSGGKLNSVCDKIRLPDDCTIGFIIYHYLKKKLTVISEFHSHLEGLWLIKPKIFRQQITMSYHKKNLVPAPGFPMYRDPSRFRSIHCHLFPDLEDCKGFLNS
eukprot:GHVU01104831.1.p1 GENE.GHVU01104831.1~~GHVU01104831.1.p1  ORF type:complete len:419 (+),score=33.58 GHVU01104831.1:97-1257(+)